MPKHVVTSTLRELECTNARALDGDLVLAVSALRGAPGGDVLGDDGVLLLSYRPKARS